MFPALSVWESVMVGAQPALLKNGSDRLLNPCAEVLCALLRPSFWKRRIVEQEHAAETALRLFGDRLWPRREQPAFSLSYANRRRLEIARLLVANPRYLLLDEPTAGMNPTETEEMTDLLLDLRKTNPSVGMLVVEHKLSMVRRIADRVVVLNQGKILVEDRPDQALDHPAVIEAYLGQSRAGVNFKDAHHG